MKQNNISDFHKEKIYNMVKNLNKKTQQQKERFIRYYGLKPKEFKKETLSTIAKESHCNISAVRISVVTIRRALFNVSEDNFLILKEIYKEYQK